MKFSFSSGRRLAAATILVSAAALGATGCSATAAASSPSMQSAAMGIPSGTDAATTALTIHIKSFAYSSPGPVAPGTTVTVMNMDPEAHTVTADDGSFDVTAPAGQSVTFTAPAKPGTYTYHCKYHATMHGTLTVK